jgi:hypothetical protein
MGHIEEDSEAALGVPVRQDLRWEPDAPPLRRLRRAPAALAGGGRAPPVGERYLGGRRSDNAR